MAIKYTGNEPMIRMLDMLDRAGQLTPEGREFMDSKKQKETTHATPETYEQIRERLRGEREKNNRKVLRDLAFDRSHITSNGEHTGAAGTVTATIKPAGAAVSKPTKPAPGAPRTGTDAVVPEGYGAGKTGRTNTEANGADAPSNVVQFRKAGQ